MGARKLKHTAKRPFFFFFAPQILLASWSKRWGVKIFKFKNAACWWVYLTITLFILSFLSYNLVDHKSATAKVQSTCLAEISRETLFLWFYCMTCLPWGEVAFYFPRFVSSLVEFRSFAFSGGAREDCGGEGGEEWRWCWPQIDQVLYGLPTQGYFFFGSILHMHRALLMVSCVVSHVVDRTPDTKGTVGMHFIIFFLGSTKCVAIRSWWCRVLNITSLIGCSIQKVR